MSESFNFKYTSTKRLIYQVKIWLCPHFYFKIMIISLKMTRFLKYLILTKFILEDKSYYSQTWL